MPLIVSPVKSDSISLLVPVLPVIQLCLFATHAQKLCAFNAFTVIIRTRVFVFRASESSMGVLHAQITQYVLNAYLVTISTQIAHAFRVPFSAKHAKTTLARAAKCNTSSMLPVLTAFFVSLSSMPVSRVLLTPPVSTAMKVFTWLRAISVLPVGVQLLAAFHVQTHRLVWCVRMSIIYWEECATTVARFRLVLIAKTQLSVFPASVGTTSVETHVHFVLLPWWDACSVLQLQHAIAVKLGISLIPLQISVSSASTV